MTSDDLSQHPAEAPEQPAQPAHTWQAGTSPESPPPSTPHPAVASSSAPGRPPLWVWPAIILGLVYPALSRSARSDVQLLERLPDPPTNLRGLPALYTIALVAAAIGIPLIFALVRVGVTNIYTESFVYLLLALAIGMLSPAAGMILVLAHAVFDLLAAMLAGELDPFIPALAGRAVTWWLLWLLAVAIPLMARALPGATLAESRPADPRLRKALAYGAGVITAAVLLLMWTGAAPFLIRPLFVWAPYITGGAPTDPAIQPIQTSGLVIVLWGALLVAAITALRDLFRVLDEEAAELSQPDEVQIDDQPVGRDELQFVSRLVTQVLSVLLLGGLVTGALDAALLFAAGLVGSVLGAWLGQNSPLGAALARIPWVVRFLGAFALTYAVGLVVNQVLTEPAFGSEFFPLVVTAALALFVFQVVLSATPREEPVPVEPSEGLPPAADGTTLSGAVAIALLAAVAAVVLAPATALANNCSGWGDCPVTADALAGAGSGAAAVVALGAALAAARAGEESRRRKARRGRKPPSAGEGGATQPPAGLAQRVRDRALRNYDPRISGR